MPPPTEPDVRSRALVGTAGHIDHGKTALVRALTGTDTDRLPEEKRRGITIDLGFARLPTSDGGSLAVVDVPGHERFVRAMVAGATGFDIALFVIAADEGVMPQTREHLDICQLLGIRRGLVALTKVDLAAPAWLTLVTDEVRAAVRGTFLESAAIVPCSAMTGAGMAAVRVELERLAADVEPRAGDGPLRLPLDRVFTLKGFGTVVTGTVASGGLREGDDVALLSAGSKRATTKVAAKVRSLEIHGVRTANVAAGQRTAANLHGIDRPGVARGDVLTHPGEMEASAIIDVELCILPTSPAPIKNRGKLLLHALTTQENATVVLYEGSEVEPGARALAQIHLERPLALLPDDRFILRGFQPQPRHGATVGGGRVIRVFAPRWRRRGDPSGASLALTQRFAAATTLDERVALEVEGAGRRGIDRATLRARTGAGPTAIDRALEGLLNRREAVMFHRDTGAVVDRRALDDVKADVVASLGAVHVAEPLRPGVAREELRTTAPRTRHLDPRLFALALAELVNAGTLHGDRDSVRLSGFSPRPAETERDALVEKVLALYRQSALAPPWSGELGARLAVTTAEAAAALEILVRRRDLVRVKPDLCFHRPAVEDLLQRLRMFLTTAGQISAQEWKTLTGQTRKYAIPLAEYFDAEKFTLRVGDARRLRGGR